MHRPDRTLRTLASAALLAGALAACGGDGPTATDGEETRPTEALTFLRPAPDAPPIANPDVSFYAKLGEGRKIFIWYHARAGQTDSSEFVEFEVPGNSLLRRPDGTFFQRGDSILVSVRVVDPARLILEFQPSGLVFNPADPARLKIRFAEANDDLDGDGDVDSTDEQDKQKLSIWRQESAGLPWIKTASTLIVESDEVEARLGGFTGYAIAF